MSFYVCTKTIDDYILTGIADPEVIEVESLEEAEKLCTEIIMNQHGAAWIKED